MNNTNENILKKHFEDNIIYRTAIIHTKYIQTTPQNQAQSTQTTPQNETNSLSNEDTNTFILISNNNATTRYDFLKDEEYIEELDNSKADFSSLKTFFTDHTQSVDTAIGKVQNIRFDETNQLLADVKFSSIPKAQEIKTKYDEGVLTDVSIGYRVNDFITKSSQKSSTPSDDISLKHILVTNYEIVELSAVWRGADRGSIKIKSDKKELSKQKGETLYETTEFENRLENLNIKI